MARRRMFSLDVVDTDLFLDMPSSSQNLYFHLGMRADDDGFIASPKRVVKSVSATDDDMRILLSKGFVIPFDSGVCVVTHWLINNTIRGDRYSETGYRDEKKNLSLGLNGEYLLCTRDDNELTPIPRGADKPKWLLARQKALKESSLPHRFTYLIRNAFVGKPCPVCGCTMEVSEFSRLRMPSIQHNTPISRGGRHELDNISVICHSCNERIGDTETGALNNPEVVTAWDLISRQPVGNQSATQVRLGKVRLGKNTNMGPDFCESGAIGDSETARFKRPTLAEVQAYCRERGNSVNAEAWMDHYASNGWRVGKTPMRDWRAAVRTWERTNLTANSSEPKAISEAEAAAMIAARKRRQS